MFTLDQIKAVHSKVKSGADFPNYVQELKALGMIYYDTYVTDGSTHYYGKNGFRIDGGAKYPSQVIADSSSAEKLEHFMKIHQQGQTDYLTFCRQAAEAGVKKWTVHLVDLLCTYYDKAGTVMVVERIPEV